MREPLPFHHAAAIFPLLHGKELDNLVADIKRHGLIEPITVLDGQILDGRNRELACIAAGVDAIYQPFRGDDPIAFVVSANIHRRHLTAEQKHELIERLLVANPEHSDRQIAKVVKISHHTVAKARKRAEGRGHIAHVDKREDTKGRKQPASKPKRKAAHAVAKGERAKAKSIARLKGPTESLVECVSTLIDASSCTTPRRAAQALHRLNPDQLDDLARWFSRIADELRPATKPSPELPASMEPPSGEAPNDPANANLVTEDAAPEPVNKDAETFSMPDIPPFLRRPLPDEQHTETSN